MADKEKRLLGIRAVEAFPDLFKDAWRHDSKPRPNKCCGLYCTKCKVEFTKQNGELDKPCAVPDPIDVNDWNVAMKLYRSLKPMNCKQYIAAVGPSYQRAGWILLGDDIHQVAVLKEWLLEEGKPTDYIKAAIAAKGVE